jgi:hypothetical protein
MDERSRAMSDARPHGIHDERFGFVEPIDQIVESELWGVWAGAGDSPDADALADLLLQRLGTHASLRRALVRFYHLLIEDHPEKPRPPQYLRDTPWPPELGDSFYV